MGIKALKDTQITFSCPCCESKKVAEDVVIDLADVVVYAGARDLLYARLPQCKKCGGYGHLIPNLSHKGNRAHIRRLVIKHAVDHGQIREGTSHEVIDRCMAKFGEFYTGRGSRQQKKEYNGEVEIDVKQKEAKAPKEEK